MFYILEFLHPLGGKHHFYSKLIINSNWIEWSTIQGVIERVISKLDEREARGRFEIKSTKSNY